jgi:hypothetical protein
MSSVLRRRLEVVLTSSIVALFTCAALTQSSWSKRRTVPRSRRGTLRGRCKRQDVRDRRVRAHDIIELPGQIVAAR